MSPYIWFGVAALALVWYFAAELKALWIKFSPALTSASPVASGDVDEHIAGLHEYAKARKIDWTASLTTMLSQAYEREANDRLAAAKQGVFK